MCVRLSFFLLVRGSFQKKAESKMILAHTPLSLVTSVLDRFGSGDLLFRGHLRWAEFENQLVYCPGESERQFVAIIHPCARINPNVEGLIACHHQWNRMG